MDYSTTEEIAKKWSISRRRVTVLCATGRIPGVIQMGAMWLIPKDAKKPADGRKNPCSKEEKEAVKWLEL